MTDYTISPYIGWSQLLLDSACNRVQWSFDLCSDLRSSDGARLFDAIAENDDFAEASKPPLARAALCRTPAAKALKPCRRPARVQSILCVLRSLPGSGPHPKTVLEQACELAAGIHLLLLHAHNPLCQPKSLLPSHSRFACLTRQPNSFRHIFLPSRIPRQNLQRHPVKRKAQITRRLLHPKSK